MIEEDIEKLIIGAKNGDEQAIESLFNLFKSKVTAISREYFLVGADFNDLIQEGMIGLYKAISVYDKDKNHNFGMFASLCIHRQLQNAVKNANRKKNSPLNSYLPIKYYDGSNMTDEEDFTNLVIVDDSSDIEKNYIDKEMNALLLSEVKKVLTEEQFDVLNEFLNGENYSKIAEKCGISVKKVDNILQNVKKKLKSLKGEVV